MTDTTEIKFSEINLEHLYLTVEVQGNGGQLIGYSPGEVILGPGTNSRIVKVGENEIVKVLGAPETPREFHHFGVN